MQSKEGKGERLPIHEVVQPRELRSGASNDAITQPQWRNVQQIVVCRNSKISNCPQEKLAVVHLGTENLLNGFFFLVILASFLSLTLLTWAFFRGGIAWKNGRNQMGRVSIAGPRGLPPFGSLFSLSHGLRHRTLACMASSHAATKLMAFSLGSTPAVITSDLKIAKEILTSSHFANRPIKKSTKCLIFSRAIGFAPNGTEKNCVC
ncbi:unnamed protein product [Prunus brigantina]